MTVIQGAIQILRVVASLAVSVWLIYGAARAVLFLLFSGPAPR